MKQIVLILLFVFTIQINTHKYKPSEDEHHKRGTVYEISHSEAKCDPGYEKRCMVIGMYVKTKNLPKRCFCYEINPEKKTKDKTTNNETTKNQTKKDKNIKDYQITGKPVKVFENSHHCKNGENYVCYDMSTSRFFKQLLTKCRCSKTRY